MRRLIPFVIVVSLLTVSACDGDSGEETTPTPVTLTSEKAALTVTDNIEATMNGLDQTLALIESSTLLNDMLDAVFGEAESCWSSYNDTTGQWEDYCEPVEPEEIEFELDTAADDIVEMLNTYLFVDSQVESDTGTKVVYLLDPAVICVDDLFGGEEPEPYPADTTADGEDGGSTSDIEECTTLLTDIPIRLAFVSYGEGQVDVDVIVGTAQATLLSLEIHQDLVSIEGDLATFKSFAEQLEAAFSDEGELDLPNTFEGKLKATLQKLGDKHYSLTWAVSSTLRIGQADGSDMFNVTMAPSSFTVDMDAVSGLSTVTAALAALDVALPYQDFIDAMWEEDDYPVSTGEPIDSTEETSEPPTVSGTMHLHLAGLSGTLSHDATSDVLTLKDLALGSEASTLKHDTTLVTSVELNGSAAGSSTMTFAETDDGMTMTASPSMTLAVALAFASIASDFEELPAFMEDDTITMAVSGDPCEILVTEDSDTAEGYMKVVSGELSLTSTSHPEDDVLVAAGQCMVGDEADDTTEPVDTTEPTEPAAEDAEEEITSLWSGLSAGACP